MISSFKESVLAGFKCILLTIFLSVLSLELEASELNAALMDREQQLLNSAEQKRQAVELIEMMQTLEKLIDYPDEAINELTGNSASHESLKRAIRALKKAKENQDEQAELKKTQQSQTGHSKRNFNHTMSADDSKLFKPILAIAEPNNGSIQSKVIFQPPHGESFSVYKGQSFSYRGVAYKLVSVSPINDGNSSDSGNRAFKITLKTPSALKHYYWPDK